MRTHDPLPILSLSLLAFLWGCNDKPTNPGDTTPPDPVQDLMVEAVSATSALLTWTAPGDDGATGTASVYAIRKLNGPISDANWNLATEVDADPIYPQSAGTVESLLVRNLVAGQEYYFALRTADESANWSALSNVPRFVTRDDTPPAAVTDLAVHALTDSSVTLSWTAPGDDGQVGQAASYQIRYALGPLTDATWSTAIPVSNPPHPGGSGFAETFEVTGLQPVIDYSFALRAEDDAHNVSELSNVAQARTTFTVLDSGDLVDELALAYSRRDYETYTDLFPATDPHFRFYLNEPLPSSETHWGVTEELRLHRRMFDPENPLPGETPVPQDLWLQSIVTSLTATTPWTERPDLYRSPSNPEGLDSSHWLAREAVYQAIVFFDTQSTTDFRVDSRQNFIVIEDLTLPSGSQGKFLFYIWEDLGSVLQTAVTQVKSWSRMKDLYR